MTITLDEVAARIDGALVHDAEGCRVEQCAAGGSVVGKQSSVTALDPSEWPSSQADEMGLE